MKISTPADAARLIKTKRLHVGFTQDELAGRVGITRQSLARIEKGHGGSSLDTFLKIFATLQIKLEATEEAEDAPRKREVALVSSPYGRELSEITRQARESIQKAVQPSLSRAAEPARRVAQEVVTQNLRSLQAQLKKQASQFEPNAPPPRAIQEGATGTSDSSD